jgi:secreted trypsin-like serine protease
MLVKGNSRSQDFSVGIVSHGPIPCNNMPIVYTRVSAYKTWIKKTACVGSNLPSWCSA